MHMLRQWCSLSMPNMFNCSMHMPIGWDNRNVGKYNLHHIWDRVLFSTPEFKINKHNGYTHRTPISGDAHTLPPNRQVIGCLRAWP